MMAAPAHETVTPMAVLTLLDGIERHGPNAPAAIAFRSALRRKGIEADALGGLSAVDSLMRAIADADPTQADSRTALCRAAWADLLPGPGVRAQP
ncbi:hypothetical protein [Methylobacterium sp.]|uniref:hypothetical protein n=1 Tax=Methylobacterium sp. TaxID=409 RepID=UPI000C3A04A0|nr:hypothetical protein [Methylobacterium sp.]MBP28116.1 hypothetical protein [Methylobacterium sp.]